MIVVTGGAGFIGSNLVRALNERGRDDIIVVDDLTDGRKINNLADLKIADYLDMHEVFPRLDPRSGDFPDVEVVFHQGANSKTTDLDGKAMMWTNYEYTKAWLSYCQGKGVPLIYASSASVYGGGTEFAEDPANEHPLNPYAYSKFLFDAYLRRRMDDLGPQVVGLRYFNVYGPREHHKDGMASVMLHFLEQLRDTGKVKLFEGSGGYGPGEQRRDFVHVDDVVAINLWAWDNPEVSGIFNAGTGRSQTYNEVAQACIDWHGSGEITYIPFPVGLAERYQSYTQADLKQLRAAGYEGGFATVQEGVPRYLDALKAAGL